MDFENFPQNNSTGAEASGFESSPDNSAQDGRPDNAVPNQEETQGQSVDARRIAGKTSCKPKQRSQKIGLFVLLAFCGILALGSIVNFINKPDSLFLPPGSMRDFSFVLSNSPFTDRLSFQTSSGKNNTEYVAVVHVEGTIQEANETYNQEWLMSTIEDLTHDDKNLGILLYIDSPGGGVYESDEVYLELLDYKEASGKPVWAYLGPMAASGGYYIACAADYIIANRNCLTGSIGVIAGQSIDFSQFLDKHGIKVTTFTAGSNKDMLGISVPVTEEQAAIMQSIADDSYNQFVGIVAESRNLTFKKAVSLADGRIYTAGQALNNGLIDDISRLDEAYQQYEEALMVDEVEFVHLSPEAEFTFVNYLFGGINALLKETSVMSGTEALLLEAKEQMMPEISYPAYYFQQ